MTTLVLSRIFPINLLQLEKLTPNTNMSKQSDQILHLLAEIQKNTAPPAPSFSIFDKVAALFDSEKRAALKAQLMAIKEEKQAELAARGSASARGVAVKQFHLCCWTKLPCSHRPRAACRCQSAALAVS